MKIQCQSCQAKYTIADEKVLGKVVKIRCKKCSSTIVINGNEMAVDREEEGGATQVYDYAAAANEQWTVNVADGDQRTMTPHEIQAEYRNGVINDETYCWKEDMPDWLPLREVEHLYALISADHAPQPSFHEEAPHVASVRPGPLFGAQEPAASPFSGHANGNGHFAPSAEAAYAAPAPSAARRGGGRGQGADLFGNVERAGGDEDVMTSANVGGAAADSSDKLTGQRNENSVLFSLSALTEGTKNAPAPSRTTATGDGSGLIDIRALSQSMGSDDKKDSRGRVDDIMNLSGGGAFGAALAAPILAPPPMDLAAPSLGGGDGAKSNKTLIAMVGAVLLVGVAIVLAIVLTRGSSDKEEATKDGTEGSSAPTAAVAANEPAPSQPATGATTAQAPPTPAPTADDTPPPPGVGHANSGSKTVAAASPKAAAPKAESHAAAEPAPKPVEAPKHTSAPTDFGSAIAAAAGKPAHEAPKESSGGGGGSAPFDRGAAAGALGGVNVQSCKKPGGPTGSGHVKVTFAPNGSVSAAVLDDAQYPGTPVGGCVAGKFRGAHIPAFSGSSVTVGKSFTIN